MDRLFILVICVVLPLVACNNPTHCERHKGNAEFNCNKDGRPIDYIHIRSIVDHKISFNIGKWMSKCGEPGLNYFDNAYGLDPQGSMDEIFSESASGVCNDIYIYKCKLEDSPVDCRSILSAYPKEYEYNHY